MKKIYILIVLILSATASFSQKGVEMLPNGLVVPRLTTAQRDSLTPQQGQIIFNKTTNLVEFFTGSSWSQTSGSGGGGGSVDLSNYVTLNTAQTISGAKSFNKDIIISTLQIGNRADTTNIQIGRNNLLNNVLPIAGGSYGRRMIAIGNNTLRNNLYSNENLAIGHDALKQNNNGGYNIAIGNQVLEKNTNSTVPFSNTPGPPPPIDKSGTHNTAIGYKSMAVNISGYENTALGSFSLGNLKVGNGNISIGYNAHTGDSTSNNISIGNSAGSISNKNNNLAIGSFALGASTDAGSNIGIGSSALYANNGENNVALGNGAIRGIITSESTKGSLNIAIGTNSLTRLKSGNSNVSIGNFSLQTNENANRNISIGDSSLMNSTTSNNLAIGFKSLNSNIAGVNNIGIGNEALFSNTGSNNTSVGFQTLKSNTANSNTAFGYQTLLENTSGTLNNAFGAWALKVNTTGQRNAAFGYNSLAVNTTGSFNTAVGSLALDANVDGGNNTGLGYTALGANISGGNNTAVGYNALSTNTTGSNNTALGYGANVSTAALSNATVIGYNASVNASNKVRIGNSSVTVIEGQVAWSNPSDRRLKENILYTNRLGLDFIKGLKTTSYNYISDNTKTRHDGFIAQDVERLMRELNIPFSGLKKSDDGTYSLAYSDFVMPLVNAVQEQQKVIEELLTKISNLEKRNIEVIQKVQAFLQKSEKDDKFSKIDDK